jgi:hypothetical protein
MPVKVSVATSFTFTAKAWPVTEHATCNYICCTAAEAGAVAAAAAAHPTRLRLLKPEQ